MRPEPDIDPVDADVDLHVPAQRQELRPRRWDVLTVIAAGGALGAEARYALGVWIPPQAGSWPASTLLVNISGCLLIGVLMVFIVELTAPHRLLRPFLGVGVLGGYTTFSTTTVETQQFLLTGRPGLALGYLVITAGAALAAVWTGAAATRLASRAVIRLTRGRKRGGRR